MAVSSRLASRKRIGVIGDSHSLFCFCEVAEASIFWRGPISMHRVGRDGLLSVLPPKCRLSDYDALVIVFGEIDCRAHVPSIATRKGLSLDAVIEDLAVRYVAAIAAVRGGFSGPIAICCVIPPAGATLPLEPGEDMAVAVRGQVYIRRLLNARLRALGGAAGLLFVDFYDAYATATGELQPSLSDGALLVSPKQTQAIVTATAATLGLALTHKPIDRDVFLIPVGNYWRRRRQLVDVWFKAQLKRMTGRA